MGLFNLYDMRNLLTEVEKRWEARVRGLETKLDHAIDLLESIGTVQDQDA